MKNKPIFKENLRKVGRIFGATLYSTMVLSCFSVDAFASAAYAQNTVISLNLENTTLRDAFKEIEKNSDFVIFYNESILDSERKVKIHIKNKTVDKILDELFAGTNNTYRVEDKQIYITKKDFVAAETKPTILEKQQAVRKKITGKVFDSFGETLPGAAIMVVGSTRGVTTDIDGTFSLDVLPTEKIIISFLGLESQTVQVGSKNSFIFKLKESVDQLDEVTVVAFGKQKKESVIASVSTIRPSELKVPSSNLTTSLAGRISGVISYQTSGEPGQDNAQFFVRGITSFGAESKKDPLILIDNIEMNSNDLARLQPDDIASFSIMKDATAAALYGSRGANGVILVTTKEGKEGKVNISVRFETSLSQPTERVELADPITYMRLHNEAVRTRNPLGLLPYSENKIQNTIAGVNPMVYPATDWYSMMFKDHTINERLNFNVNGGGKVARYYLSGTFNQDNGILNVAGKNNFNNNIDLKRYILRANININITPTTEAIVRMHGAFDDYGGPIDSGTTLFNKVMKANPVLFPAIYDADENNKYAKQILFGNAGEGKYTNPYADMVKGYKNSSTSKMLSQIELKQKLDFLTEGLSIRFMANTDRYSSFDVQRYYTPYYYSMDTYDRVEDAYTLKSLNEGSEALEYKERTKLVTSSFYLESALSYNKEFNEKHAVSGLLVYTLRERLKGNAGSLQLSLPFRNVGFAGRFTYGYDSRYFGELNFGYNGSERFSKKERYGFFPSAGLGWIASNESFYSDGLKKILPKLKFKATYGLVGNDQIGSDKDRFFYLSEVNMNNGDKGASFGTDFGYNKPGVSIGRYENPMISWETAYKMNLGIELNLLDRIEIQADYFTEHRTNILMNRTAVPPTMGLQATPNANVGEAQGGGFEFSVDYNHSFSNGLWMTGRGNFTYATSEFKVYEEPDYSESTPWKSRIGRSLGQEWGYVAERLFVDELDILNSPVQNFGGDFPVMAGDIKYKDINMDGKISDLDKVPIGYPKNAPEVIYGFGLSAGYKGFDFSCFFQGSARSTFWIDPNTTQPFKDGQNALMKAYADSHWSEANRDLNALWPRLSEGNVENNQQLSTWFMRDGSFLRLKSVELGYTVPQKITEKAFISMLRIYGSGTNLLTFSKFDLWDPEMGGNGLGYPIQKVFNVGIQLTF